jgi:hypothetical protein
MKMVAKEILEKPVEQEVLFLCSLNKVRSGCARCPYPYAPLSL